MNDTSISTTAMKTCSLILNQILLLIFPFSLFSFQSEPLFILSPEEVKIENHSSVLSTLQELNATHPRVIVGYSIPKDSFCLFLEKAWNLTAHTSSSPIFEAELREMSGKLISCTGASLEVVAEHYLKAIEIYKELNQSEKVIRASLLLASNYYDRPDSSILLLGPLCQQGLDMYGRLDIKDKERLKQSKQSLNWFQKIARSYEKLDISEVNTVREKHSKAMEYGMKAALHRIQTGLQDSIYHYSQITLELLGSILNKVDDPRILPQYFGARAKIYEYMKSQLLLQRSAFQVGDDLSYLKETYKMAKELSPDGSFSSIECQLFDRLVDEAPSEALGLMEKRYTSWDCMRTVSKLYRNIGDFQKAIEFDKNRLERLRSINDHMLASQDLGQSYLEAGYYKEAEYFIRQAMQDLPKRLSQTHPRRMLAPYQLGTALAGQNRLSDALPLVIEAEEMWVQQKGVIAGGPLKEIYAEHAHILAKTGDFAKARSYLDKALQCAALDPNVAAYNRLKLLAIQISRLAGDYNSALDSTVTFITSLKSASTSIVEVSFPRDLMRAYQLKGDILIQQFTEDNHHELLLNAQQAYQQAIEVVDWIRQSYYGESSKLFIQQEAVEFFNKAIDVSLQLYQLTHESHYKELAFSFLERKKGVLLLESVQRSDRSDATPLPNDIQLKERNSKLSLDYYHKQIFRIKQERETEEQRVKIRELEAKALVYQKSYDSLMLVIQQDYPRYYQLNYGINTASVGEIQKGLRSSSNSLISYSLHQDKLYAFVLTGQDFKVIEIPLLEDLTEKIQQLQKSVFSSFVLKDISLKQRQAYNDTLIRNAYLLYQQLITPILEQIHLPEKIIISPDGPLGYIPFEMLLKDLPNEISNFGSHPYLIKDYQISYTYSGTLLQEMQSKSHASPRSGLLGFAPVFAGVDADSVSENQSVASIRGGLTKLHFNIPEVEEINRLMNGVSYIGVDATEDNFLSEAHKYQIIHLSTHGVVNEENGKFSFLAFTEVEDSLENEFLYNQELYNLELNADMVVLSACETGIGQLYEGEGILSLARGFSYAGAKSIITSLWSVNDASSKELMEQFYRYIREGKSKDEALRQAKLDFIDKHVNEAHPFFWAPFIAIGDMEPIQFSSNMKYLYYGLGVLLISFLYWRSRKARKV